MLNFSKFFKLNKNDYLDVSKQDILKQHKTRKNFHNLTNKNVSGEHIQPIRKYLSNSKDFDDFYKNGAKTKAIADEAKKIEEVIKKTRTPQNLILYRGFQSEEDIGPGTIITHRSITSYGGSKAFADMYYDKTRQNHLIKLRLPKGSHAAYIEHIAQERHHKFSKKEMERMFNHGGEENWVLHPGAKIKITKTEIGDRGILIHHAELISDGIN